MKNEKAFTQIVHKCSFCGRPLLHPYRKKIYSRGGGGLKIEDRPFCNPDHAGQYQMGCEG